MAESSAHGVSGVPAKKQFFGPHEAAAFLGYSARHFRKLKLPSIGVGRRKFWMRPTLEAFHRKKLLTSP